MDQNTEQPIRVLLDCHTRSFIPKGFHRKYFRLSPELNGQIMKREQDDHKHLPTFIR